MLILIHVPLYIKSFNAEFKALMTPVTFQFADDAGGDSQLYNTPTEY